MKDNKMNAQTHVRRSSDDVWPLRNAEGLTFAEAKRRRSVPAVRKHVDGQEQSK
jgi:hypothetical protein